MTIFENILTHGGDIASALLTNTTVYLHPGAYTLGQMLTLRLANVTIIGAGEELVTITSLSRGPFAIESLGAGFTMRGVRIIAKDVTVGIVGAHGDNPQVSFVTLDGIGACYDTQASSHNTRSMLTDFIAETSDGHAINLLAGVANTLRNTLVESGFAKSTYSGSGREPLSLRSNNNSSIEHGPTVMSGLSLITEGTDDLIEALNKSGGGTGELVDAVFSAIACRNEVATSGAIGLNVADVNGAVIGGIASIRKTGTTQDQTVTGTNYAKGSIADGAI